MFPQPNSKEPLPQNRNFTPLPEGWYRALITEIKNEQMQSGNGERTKVIVDILSDGYKGRKAFLSINARHTNPTTEGIGQRQIDSLLEATGITRATLQSYVQLQRKEVLVKLKIKAGLNGRGPDNDLVTFAKPDAIRDMVPPPSRLGTQQQGGGAPAWQNNAPPQGQGGQAPLWQGGGQQQAAATPAAQQPAQQQPAQTQVSTAAPTQQQTAPAAAGGGSVPPWKR